MDFDETRLYYSHQQLHQSSSSAASDKNGVENDEYQPEIHEDEENVPVATMRRHFREFFRTYQWMLLWGSERLI